MKWNNILQGRGKEIGRKKVSRKKKSKICSAR